MLFVIPDRHPPLLTLAEACQSKKDLAVHKRQRAALQSSIDLLVPMLEAAGIGGDDLADRVALMGPEIVTGILVPYLAVMRASEPPLHPHDVERIRAAYDVLDPEVQIRSGIEHAEELAQLITAIWPDPRSEDQ